MPLFTDVNKSSRFDAITAALKAHKHWLLWKRVEGRKIPCQPCGKPAKSTTESTWSTYDDVIAAYRRGGYDGVGIALGSNGLHIEGGRLFVIDLDDCFDDQGNLKPHHKEIVDAVGGYTERSPSGNGIRILATSAWAVRSTNKADGVDVFSFGQYVTLTGDVIDNKPISPLPATAKALLAKHIKPPKDDRAEAHALTPYLAGLLDDYDDWIAAGMAFHAVFDGTNEGVELWDIASQESAHYEAGECTKKYKSFTVDGGIGIGTLVHLASRNGYVSKRTPIVLSNYRVKFDEKGKARKTAREQTHIVNDIARILPGLCSCRDTLIAVQDDSSIRAIRNEAELFATIQTKVSTSWASGVGPTKREVFEALRSSVEHINGIERAPHFPPQPETLYLSPSPVDRDLSELKRLLDLFNPATSHDKLLILAMFATVAWGGPAGKRPAFILTSHDEVGSGKTTLAEVAGRIGNMGRPGVYSLDGSRDFGRLVSHIVQVSDESLRVILVDNVRSMLAGEDLERMITAEELSGHQLYVGRAAVPNYFTWIFTANHLVTSPDIASRAIPIRIKKPDYDPEWNRTLASIDYSKVYAGLAAFFDRPKTKLPDYNRWAVWADEILSRIPEAAEVLKTINERQSGLTSVDDDALAVRERIVAMIRASGRDPDTAHVHITSTRLAMLFDGLDGRRNWSGKAVSGHLSVVMKSAQLNELDKCRDTSRRGYVWRGALIADEDMECGLFDPSPEFGNVS